VIASGADLRVAHVTLGGFDTHSAQRTDHEALLRQLGDGLAAFHDDLAAQGRDGDVLTMTWSEFGRRIPENASEGTDHGAAAPMFLLGGGVAGGFYGDPPSVEDSPPAWRERIRGQRVRADAAVEPPAEQAFIGIATKLGRLRAGNEHLGVGLRRRTEARR